MSQAVLDYEGADADTLPGAAVKINANFDELYAADAAVRSVATGGTGVSSFTAQQIVFGAAGGDLAQSAGLTYDDTNNALTIGSVLIYNRGTNNTFIGQSAGNFSQTGGNNTVLGYNAGIGLTSGLGNTLIGANAGIGLTNGGGNTLIGAGVGDSVSSGLNNTLIGYAAGAALTTTSNNTFIGRNAGNANTGSVGTAVGVGSLLNGSGAANTVVGDTSMGGSGLTTANNNTVVGRLSFSALTSGVGNVAVGNQAGIVLTDGTNNTLIGRKADVSSGSAIERTVIGYLAVGDTDQQVFLGDANVTAWVPGAADSATLGRDDREFQGLYLANGVDTTAGISATINKATGRFRLSAASAAFTLTNSRIAAGDHVGATVITSDATCMFLNCQPAAGSCVFNFIAPTGNTDVSFFVVKN